MANTSFVFFGSGPVALASLRALTAHNTIEAIITKPATEAEMNAAVPGQAPVFAVENRAQLDALFASQQFHSQFAILIDFGVIVSQAVIDTFPLGIINSHFSLLPEWRGADPITFAILSGQHETGISLMLLTAGMDEGPILKQVGYAIPPTATTPELTDALVRLSNATLQAVLPDYLQHTIQPRPQIGANILGITKPTYSRKLTKDDGLIDWHKPALQLEREIRAFISWPKSRSLLANREVIITAAAVSKHEGKPGEIIIDGSRFFVCCGEGSLEIQKIKPAGKGEMPARAFLAGYSKYL